MGEPVRLSFRLTSRASGPLLVLARGTPLEGLVGPYLDVRCDGERIPYDGMRVKRGPLGTGEYVRIGPGETLSRDLEVHRGYAISRVGTYSVAYPGSLDDHVAPGAAESLEARVARIRAEGGMAPAPVRSEPWVLRVIAGGRPLPTDGARARGEG